MVKRCVPTMVSRRRSHVITFGSDFSGMGTLSMAGKHVCAKIGAKVVTNFTCDTSKACKKFLFANVHPKMHYNNVMHRNEKLMPPVDVYGFTSECDTFSMNGKQQGLDDPRGEQFFVPLKYVQEQKPTCIIAENSPLLLSKFSAVARTLKDALIGLGYSVQDQLVTTSDYGIPQKRRRWYLLGIRTSALRKIKVAPWFPPKMACCVKLTDLMDRLPAEEMQLLPQATCERLHVMNAIQKVAEAGHNVQKVPILVDIGGSEGYASFSFNGISPTF